MTPQELYIYSNELWGDNWDIVLANKFDIRVKSVRRWTSGKSDIPQAVIAFIEFQKNRGAVK